MNPRLQQIQRVVLALTAILMLPSVLGLLLAPASMLGVVGIASSPSSDFLLRASGTAAAGLIPGALFALRFPASPASRWILSGLAGYMLLSCAVDALAFNSGLVNAAAVPSVAFRTALGLALAGLAVAQRQAS